MIAAIFKMIGIALCLLALATEKPAAAATLWSGNSGGFAVEWTDQNIVATRDRDGIRVFCAAAFADASFADAKRLLAGASSGADPEALTVMRKISIVSIAGPFLAIKDESYLEITPSAHPGGETRFWTIDLSQDAPPKFDPDDPFAPAADDGGRLVTALRLFSGSDLLNALKKDLVIGGGIPKRVLKLDEALQALMETPPVQPNLCFEVPVDFLSRFAIIGIDKGEARIRLGLPGAETCRHNLTQIGVTVPLRASMRSKITSVEVPPSGIKPLELTETTR